MVLFHAWSLYSFIALAASVEPTTQHFGRGDPDDSSVSVRTCPQACRHTNITSWVTSVGHLQAIRELLIERCERSSSIMHTEGKHYATSSCLLCFIFHSLLFCKGKDRRVRIVSPLILKRSLSKAVQCVFYSEWWECVAVTHSNMTTEHIHTCTHTHSLYRLTLGPFI